MGSQRMRALGAAFQMCIRDSLKGNAVFTGEPVSDVTQFFHILEAVAGGRGSVITPEGKCDMTTYACCVDAARGVYYYKT